MIKTTMVYQAKVEEKRDKNKCNYHEIFDFKIHLHPLETFSDNLVLFFFTSLGILCNATIYRAPSSKPNEKIQLTFIMFAHRIFECIEWHSVCHFTHTYQSLWDPLETSIEYIGSFNKQFLCLTMHTFVSTIQSEKQT